MFKVKVWRKMCHANINQKKAIFQTKQTLKQGKLSGIKKSIT